MGQQRGPAVSELAPTPTPRATQWVWYDYMSMYQGERTPRQNAEFSLMLPNINMIYLGASVLILLDMAYLSRTRTRIELTRLRCCAAF